MSTDSAAQAKPARDFAEATASFAALQRLDGPEIAPTGRSLFLNHGERTPLAVVLLHGLTNAPQQWAQFGASLHASGHTVVVPRLPGHGHVERNGGPLAKVTANDLQATASAAVDIAAGAGERVVVAGLSIGGVLAARLALDRADLSRSVVIVPLFGLKRLAPSIDRTLAVALGIIPNFYVAWDASQVPSYGYLRFPSRMFASVLGAGVTTYDRSRTVPARARIALLLNAKEPAIDNGLAFRFARRVERLRPGTSETTVLADLPANHDIIDPTNPHARVALVYPALRELIDA